MSQLSLQAQPLGKEDELIQSFHRLRKALATSVPGRERAWAKAMEVALYGVEAALRGHMSEAEDPDGLFAEVDATRPTLARQASGLCSDHGELLKQVLALQEEVRRAGDAFQPSTDSLMRTEAGLVLDFGTIRQQAELLLTSLQQNKEAETHLVMDSINTDIGVGD